MTGIAITAVRPVTVCLHVTTQLLSPTHLCTSTRWGLGHSIARMAAQTLPTVSTWTTGTQEEAGRPGRPGIPSLTHALLNRHSLSLHILAV